MARRTKDAPGRVTPKGGPVKPVKRTVGRDPGSGSGGRYTAPIPSEYRSSPWWVPTIMLGFFACGLLMIVLNYISLLPSAPSNWYLLGGLGLIICGFAVSTQYR